MLSALLALILELFDLRALFPVVHLTWRRTLSSADDVLGLGKPGARHIEPLIQHVQPVVEFARQGHGASFQISELPSALTAPSNA